MPIQIAMGSMPKNCRDCRLSYFDQDGTLMCPCLEREARLPYDVNLDIIRDEECPLKEI